MNLEATKAWRAALLVAVMISLAAWSAPGAAAQSTASMRGQVLSGEGKPFPVGDVVVVLKNKDQGQSYQLKPDKNGNFLQAGLPGGIYEFSVKVKDTVQYQITVKLTSGEQRVENVNFKEIIAKQSGANAEAQKKAEEETKKFEGMKGHFDAGVASLEKAKQDRIEVQHATSDQRAPLQEKLSEDAGQAASEFQAALQAMSEADISRHVILAKLGEAYEIESKFEEAAAAYQKAIDLKRDQAGYYNNLGNVLAKLKKIPEAKAAYQKSAEIDPANAANAWRNMGIVLFQSGNYKDAVEPLKKSLELDPKSAQGWYVLGAVLVGNMDFKKEGDKMVPVMQPGTIEAYQKCIELDPNGPFGQQAKEGLAQLQAMGLGIETKVKQRPPKKNP